MMRAKMGLILATSLAGLAYCAADALAQTRFTEERSTLPDGTFYVMRVPDGCT